jgi:hypothetical protein
MKALPLIFLFFTLSFFGCSNDGENRGAQADQDYPSNRDTEIEESKNDTVMVKEYNRGSDPDSISEAPNSGNTNPAQGIQGQTGTNQTGSQNPR